MPDNGKPFDVTEVTVADLRPHPKQSELFSRPAKAEIVALAEDMQRRRLQHPIEVTSDLTIICGHSRVEAARYCGWEKIPAIVRHDLGSLNDFEIERHMIADNALRRQLRPLERARCAHRLRELYHGGDYDRLTDDAQDDVHHHTREWVGAMMNVSGRTVTRLLAILQTPEPVQRAYDESRISLVLATKIANLSPCDQEAIARAIQRGVDPKEAAREFVSCRRRPTAEETVFKRLVAALSDAIEGFREGFDGVRAVGDGEDDPVPTLREGVSLLDALADHVERRQEKQAAALAERIESIGHLIGTGRGL